MEAENGVNYSIIGKRIKEARLRENFTQEMLADEMNVSVAYISRVENGKSQINLKRLVQICKILDIPEAEILTGSNIYSKQYLKKELYDILVQCSPERQTLIYSIAKLVADAKFI